MTADTAPLRIKLQIFCGGAIAMGPGKADLLEAIAAVGSISAAARAMGLSYRRAWLLVDAMNRCWAAPLVVTTKGGAGKGGGAGGGARLSPLGTAVLAHYRTLEAVAASAGTGTDWQALVAQLRAVPLAHQRRPSSTT